MSTIVDNATVMLKYELRGDNYSGAITARVLFVVDPSSEESVVGLNRPLLGRTDWRVTDLVVVPGGAYVEHFEEQIGSSLILAREWAERADISCMVFNVFEAETFDRFQIEMWELCDAAAKFSSMKNGEELLAANGHSPRNYHGYHKAAHGTAQRQAARILLNLEDLLEKAKKRDEDEDEDEKVFCMYCVAEVEVDISAHNVDCESIKCPHCGKWFEISYA